MISSTNTTTRNASDQAREAADQLGSIAERAVDQARRGANETLDRLEGGVRQMRANASPTASRLASQAEDLAHRGIDAVRENAAHLRDRAVYASERSRRYVQDEPVKAVLIAAAAGAAIVALAAVLTRSRDRRDY